MSRVGRFAASILISAALIYVAFQNIDWPQVVDQLKAIPLPYILIFAFIQVVMFACRVWRWALLVNPFAPLTQILPSEAERQRYKQRQWR